VVQIARTSSSEPYEGYAYEAIQNWARAGDSFVSFLDRVDPSDPRAASLVTHATRQAGLTLARTLTPRRAIPWSRLSIGRPTTSTSVSVWE
jgi:hypothetical protein